MCVNRELSKQCSVYFLDEWISYTEQVTGLRAERVRYSEQGKEYPALEGVLYLNKKGRVEMPFTCAYITLRFLPTETKKDCQLYQQRMAVTRLFAEDIKRRGWSETLVMPPGFDDARVFQWLGVDTDVQYTFVTELPYNEEKLDTSVRKNIRKAEKLGYTAERTRDMNEIFNCLKKTAEYHKFVYQLDHNMLSLCEKMIDNDYLYGYIGKSSEGTTVSAQVKLAFPGGLCIDWLAGTDRNYINSGINQLLYAASLTEISLNGSIYFDNCGANIESVARAKSQWGFVLTPYIVINSNPLLKNIKKSIKRNESLYKIIYRLRNKCFCL